MQKKAIKLFDVLFAVFIFTVAFLVRFSNLDSLPINHDEANWARFFLTHLEFIKKFPGFP